MLSFSAIRLSHLLSRLSLASLLVLTCLPSAQAGKLYRFQDADGNELLTNQVDDNRKPLNGDNRQYRKLVKVTWYPDTNVHRYHNWGGSEASVKHSASRNRNAYDDLIRAAAIRHNLDFGLVKAVIHTESGFDPNARSGPGAQGLMQLMPATARRYRVANAWDPAENIEAGSRHLRYLLNRYGELPLALAAYNAGEGNVDKYGGIPPFPETRDYVQRVSGRLDRLYSANTSANTSASLGNLSSNISVSAASNPHVPVIAN